MTTIEAHAFLRAALPKPFEIVVGLNEAGNMEVLVFVPQWRCTVLRKEALEDEALAEADLKNFANDTLKANP